MKLHWFDFLHPFLFAAYPIIGLISYNIEEIKIEVGYRSLLISLISAFVINGVFYLITKSWGKSALLTTLSLLLFFSYGHIYHALRDLVPNGFQLIRHRSLLPGYLLLYFIGVYLVMYKTKNSRIYHQSLNLIAITALILPMFQIAKYSLSIKRNIEMNDPSQNSILSMPKDKTAPDIYYIIVDAYSRDDVLRDFYDFDNHEFLTQLTDLGFFVAECSQSNYAQTQLSLASSLNYNYLENLDDEYQQGNTSRAGLFEHIRHNRSREELEKLGYKIYAFQTGFKTTEWNDADYFLSPQNEFLGYSIFVGGLTDFELMVIRNSLGLVLEDSVAQLPDIIQPDFNNPLRIHRERILYAFSKLAELPEAPSPKYVYAHLVIPHPPYVFDAQGKFTDYEVDDDPGYINQLNYLNSQLIPLFERIITNSVTPPIIVLQADHGGINTPPERRTKILNAYFLPDSGIDLLYPGISPVNTFRVIFNKYFDASLGFLPDRSYFSVYKDPYNYSIIIDKRVGCSP